MAGSTFIVKGEYLFSTNATQVLTRVREEMQKTLQLSKELKDTFEKMFPSTADVSKMAAAWGRMAKQAQQAATAFAGMEAPLRTLTDFRAEGLSQAAKDAKDLRDALRDAAHFSGGAGFREYGGLGEGGASPRRYRRRASSENESDASSIENRFHPPVPYGYREYPIARRAQQEYLPQIYSRGGNQVVPFRPIPIYPIDREEPPLLLEGPGGNGRGGGGGYNGPPGYGPPEPEENRRRRTHFNRPLTAGEWNQIQSHREGQSLLRAGTGLYFTGQALAGSAQAALHLAEPVREQARWMTNIRATVTHGDEAQAQSILEWARLLQASPEGAGTSVNRNLATFSSLYGLIGNVKETEDIIRRGAPLATTYAALHPEQGNYEDVLEHLIQSAELQRQFTRRLPDGRQEYNAEGLMRYLDVVGRVTLSQQGRFSPNDIQQTLASAGVEAANFAPDDLAMIASIKRIYGSRRLGTMLNAYSQQWAAGYQSKGVISMMEDWGLITEFDPKGRSYIHNLGMGRYRVDPRAYKSSISEIVEHPTEFIKSKLLPGIDKELAGEYPRWKRMGEGERWQYRLSMMQSIASRIPGGTFMAEVLNTYYQQSVDRALAAAVNTKQATNITAQSPELKLNQFSAAWQRFQTAILSPGFDALVNRLTYASNALNQLSASAEKHPKESSQLTADVAEGGILAGVGYGIQKTASVLASAFGRVGMAGVARGGLWVARAARGATAIGLGLLGLDAVNQAIRWKYPAVGQKEDELVQWWEKQRQQNIQQGVQSGSIWTSPQERAQITRSNEEIAQRMGEIIGGAIVNALHENPPQPQLHVDGQKLTETISPHITSIIQRQTREDMSHYDDYASYAYPQAVPNAGG